MTEEKNDTNDNDIVPMIGTWQQRIAQDEEAVVTTEPHTTSTSTNAPTTDDSKPWWKRNKKVIAAEILILVALLATALAVVISLLTSQNNEEPVMEKVVGDQVEGIEQTITTLSRPTQSPTPNVPIQLVVFDTNSSSSLSNSPLSPSQDVLPAENPAVTPDDEKPWDETEPGVNITEPHVDPGDEETKVCLRITTGSNNRDVGFLDVFVDKGNGYKEVTNSGQEYNVGEVVIDKCYTGFSGIKVRNKSSNAWRGKIEASIDDKVTYYPMICTDEDGCTGSAHTSTTEYIAVDGNDNAEDITCANGNKCNLKLMGKCFADRDELKLAVDQYIDNDCTNNKELCKKILAQTYGYPINTWCVGKVT